MKIAHLSDLHFSKLNFGMLQFFSKRWLGNLNLLVHRRKQLKNNQPFTVIPYLEKLGTTHVIISGDLTTTSYRKEFLLAQRFIEELRTKGFKVYLIPGNHDNYTHHAYKKKTFFNYFSNDESISKTHSLANEQVEAHHLEGDYYLVLMDTSYPSYMFQSTGKYTDKIHDNFSALLSLLPETAKVILVNHFPLFQHESPRRVMKGAKELQSLLQMSPKVKLYLHGHTHRLCYADLRPSHLPIILDSGSLSHVKKGSWNFLETSPDSLTVKVFHKAVASKRALDSCNWVCIEQHQTEI